MVERYIMDKKLEELIVKEYIKIVKELKEMGEGDEALNAADAIEGIISLSKENMMTYVWEVIDSVDVK